MRLKIVFNCNKNIILSVDLNYYIQSFIYKNISSELAEFLHDKGYSANGRIFKLFTFSKLFGQCTFDKQNKRFHFFPPVTIYIASPIESFIRTFANHILINNDLHIGNNKLEVMNISFENDEVNEEVYVKTLSPIVVYSTMYEPNGKKYTCYFMPGDPKFESLIAANLTKKLIAYGQAPENSMIELKPIGSIEQKIVSYKGFIIKGSEGRFLLKGSKNVVNIALNSGLGAKNSQGFGFIIQDRKE